MTVDDDAPFSPNWVSPPGDSIAMRLEEIGTTYADWHAATGLTLVETLRLIRGFTAITAELAAALAAVLGSTPGFWMQREMGYQAELVRLGLKR